MTTNIFICPSCRGNLSNQFSFSVLEELDHGSIVFYLECFTCGIQQIGTMIVVNHHVDTTIMRTDLTRQEADVLYMADSVTYDDVLNFHQFINTNSYIYDERTRIHDAAS